MLCEGVALLQGEIMLRAARLVLASLALLIIPMGALAHDGHDHGPPASPLPISVKPRIAAQSDIYELVASVVGTQLTIYLDRYATNDPVVDAGIEIVNGSIATAASANVDGTYSASMPGLAAPGKHDLVFSISHKDGDDLLNGSIEIGGTVRGNSVKPVGPELRQSSVPPGLRPMLVGFSLAAVVAGFLFHRQRIVVIIAILVGATAIGSAAFAHDGHVASPVPSGDNLAGDVPRRLSDASVFMSKASQRLLTIRTQLVKETDARRGTSLIGHIIADPNRSGVVQSIAGGRVSAPEAGLPQLGQSVKKGDVLATIVPALPLADQSTIAEKQRELEGAILLAQQKVARLKRLGPGTTPRSQIDDIDLEINNLQQRIEKLKEAKLQPETLTAPSDGVISASRVVSGQVVQAQDVLFQIVDPLGFWVEALVFDQLDPGTIVEATALTPAGVAMRLVFKGRGRALQQQSVRMQFAIENAPSSVSLGMPVTVYTRGAQTVKGMLLPRDAVVRGAAGDSVVWQHVDPERFLPRPVRTESFDGDQVLVTGGISAEDRIVVHGVELLAQIR